MKFSYKWLKEYVDLELTPYELADKLTHAGFEVEEVIQKIPFFKDVVIGFVKELYKHPDADKLSVCTVDDGKAQYQVICGAANIRAGQKVPFAKIGAELPGDFKIRKAKIRGTESLGMICSQAELGLEEHSDGIWILPDDTTTGLDFYDYLGSEQDYILDIFITPNRGDCMSMIGMAREIAAILDKQIRYPEFVLTETGGCTTAELISVEVQDVIGCPRYSARIVRNVQIGESPEWLQKKLRAVGFRPINNIVDITNYVLFEYGQPLHGFDLSKIKSKKITVRRSLNGEKFITLDGKERDLPAETLLICDTNEPVAVAGIMGGQNSEVHPETTDILIESAVFSQESIAVAGKKLGLSTEASRRFERSVDTGNTIKAMNRAAYLMQEIAQGKICQGYVDLYPQPIPQHKIDFNINELSRLLGASYENELVQKLFARLGIKVDDQSDSYIIPSFRNDLKLPADLVEEFARLIGYSALPARNQSTVPYSRSDQETGNYYSKITSELIMFGLTEFANTSMYGKSELQAFSETSLVTILNPISDDMACLRPSILPGLLKSAAYNINRGQKNIRAFETGRVFFPDTEGGLPIQPYHLGVLLSGKRFEESWNQPDDSIDFFDMKGIIEQLFAAFKYTDYSIKIQTPSLIFAQGEAVDIFCGHGKAGSFGKVRKEILKIFAVRQDVYAAELNIEMLYPLLTPVKTIFISIPKYPFIEKDLAFVIEKSVPSLELINYIREIGGAVMTGAWVFDLYEGTDLPENKHSLNIRLHFQATDRTLTDNEIDDIFQNIIRLCEVKFNATLRN